jgi:hypothetical protein
MRLTERVLGTIVGRADDAKLERRFGSPIAQRVMFTAMARRFKPEAAGRFQGAIVYELSRPATGAPPTRWTVEVADGRARARPGAAENAKLTLGFRLADFMRIAAGALDPVVPVLQGRATVKGDFGLAARLPQMFGAVSPR